MRQTFSVVRMGGEETVYVRPPTRLILFGRRQLTSCRSSGVCAYAAADARTNSAMSTPLTRRFAPPSPPTPGEGHSTRVGREAPSPGVRGEGGRRPDEGRRCMVSERLRHDELNRAELQIGTHHVLRRFQVRRHAVRERRLEAGGELSVVRVGLIDRNRERRPERIAEEMRGDEARAALELVG